MRNLSLVHPTCRPSMPTMPPCLRPSLPYLEGMPVSFRPSFPCLRLRLQGMPASFCLSFLYLRPWLCLRPRQRECRWSQQGHLHWGGLQLDLSPCPCPSLASFHHPIPCLLLSRQPVCRRLQVKQPHQRDCQYRQQGQNRLQSHSSPCPCPR